MKITQLTLFTLLILSLTIVSHAAANETETVFVDGREVVLNNDGTWKYRSTDRYADTKEGVRIRLKEDGSWQTVGNALLSSKEQVRTTDLDIKLQKVVIETYKKKVQKNTSVKTQTVFYVQLAYSPQAKNSIDISQKDITNIEVKDNNGKNYPVLSMKPGTTTISPGTHSTLVIRAEKSPSIWDSVKSMEIVFKPGILGLNESVKLSQRTNDFDEVNVSGFE